METSLKITNCVTDFEALTKRDLENDIKIKVFSNVHDLERFSDRGEIMQDGTIFMLWIEVGEKTIMLDAPINGIELFARSLLSHIKIIRKSYKKQINSQLNMGAII